MLQLKDIAYRTADKELFSGLNWIINPGQHMGLMGANGTGKTTLLRLIIGTLQPSEGTIIKPSNYTIGYLPQEEIAVGNKSLLAEVLDGHQEIVSLEAELATIHHRLSCAEISDSEKERLLMRLGKLEHHYTMLGGYTLESEAKKIVTGLGFAEDQFDTSLNTFSGGWRMRAYLARLLMQKPHLLLLDEPTNHLDVSSLEWLESYLMSFPGSVIIVSHDRYFIDRLVQGIGIIEHHRFDYYAGNYHYYEKQKQLVQVQLLKKAEEIKAEKERLNRFIERFRYKATKAAQVQSRIKRLQKLEEIQIPKIEKEIAFRITVPVSSYKEVCTLENLYFRYDSEWILKDINLKLYRGDKIALVGINGAGKTTLSRLATRQLMPQKGKIIIGENVSTGYYAQHQLDSLNLDNTIYQELSASAAPVYRSQLRDILGLFHLSGDDINKKIAVLSGGEKARVSLAKILISPVNFLVMDEPTNHLDIRSKESLEKALSNYDGTLLLISHDRYFLDKIVTRVIEIRQNQLRLYEGNYTDYLNKKQTLSTAEEQPMEKPVVRRHKEQKRLEAEARQRISRERHRLTTLISNLEAEIETLEHEIQQLEANMSTVDFYKNKETTVDSTRRYQEIKVIVADRYRAWEEAGQQLELLLTGIRKE
jgi:ATP-binding cassette subfamily F protein 3